MREEKPWDNTPSIFDGWTKQIRGALQGWDGSYCAIGFLSKNEVLDYELGRRYTRIDEFIRHEYPERPTDLCAVAFANDILCWTPEDFRNLDRRLEWEYQTAQLARQIEGIEAREEVTV